MPLIEGIAFIIIFLILVQSVLVYRAGGPKAYRDQLLGRNPNNHNGQS